MDSTFIQLSDFGLAICDGNPYKNNIKLSGTLGYVAPEYLLDGMTVFFLTVKFHYINYIVVVEVSVQSFDYNLLT